MARLVKLIERFKTKPADFSWQELKTLLFSLGYELFSCGKTSGSRIKFIHSEKPPIFLHKPHPNKILKRYQIEYVYNFLKNEQLL